MTPVPPRASDALLRQLRRLAFSIPRDIAIQGSGVTLDWAGVHGAVADLGRHLAGCDTLGILVRNSPAWILADLAGMACGIRLVPLPGFFADRQLQHVVEDAAVDSVLTDDPARVLGMCNHVDNTYIRVAGVELSLVRLRRVHAVSARADKVTYTSGTTATPRGVVLSQSSINTVARSLREATQANRGDRALVLMPLSTLLENIGSVYVPMLAGARILVPDPRESGLAGSSALEPGLFASMLRRYRPTTMIVPPGILKACVALAARGLVPDSFRFIAVGGAPAGLGLLREARAAGLPVYEGYGLSEACSVVAVNTPRHSREGSVGRPLSHCAVRISDSGEVMVSGCLYRGYLNGDGAPGTELPSGDIGHLDDDGYLYISGRSKNVIITGFGRNVSPEWVEAELVTHRDIAQAVVLTGPAMSLQAVLVPADRPGGMTTRRLTIAVNSINARLPDYARIGAFVTASGPFSAASGELTANGRPRRDVIAMQYAAASPNHTGVRNECVL